MNSSIGLTDPLCLLISRIVYLGRSIADLGLPQLRDPAATVLSGTPHCFATEISEAASRASAGGGRHRTDSDWVRPATGSLMASMFQVKELPATDGPNTKLRTTRTFCGAPA